MYDKTCYDSVFLREKDLKKKKKQPNLKHFFASFPLATPTNQRRRRGHSDPSGSLHLERDFAVHA